MPLAHLPESPAGIRFCYPHETHPGLFLSSLASKQPSSSTIGCMSLLGSGLVAHSVERSFPSMQTEKQSSLSRGALRGFASAVIKILMICIAEPHASEKSDIVGKNPLLISVSIR